MDGVRGLVKKRCSVLGLSTVDTTPEARAPEVPMSREMGNCAGTTGASIRPTGWSLGAQRANARRAGIINHVLRLPQKPYGLVTQYRRIRIAVVAMT